MNIHGEGSVVILAIMVHLFHSTKRGRGVGVGGSSSMFLLIAFREFSCHILEVHIRKKELFITEIYACADHSKVSPGHTKTKSDT